MFPVWRIEITTAAIAATTFAAWLAYLLWWPYEDDDQLTAVIAKAAAVLGSLRLLARRVRGADPRPTRERGYRGQHRRPSRLFAFTVALRLG
jgi:hypothetical protein